MLLAAVNQLPLVRAMSHAMRDRLTHILPQVAALQKIRGTATISIGVMTYGRVILDHSLGFAGVKRSRSFNQFHHKIPIASLTNAFVASTTVLPNSLTKAS